MTWTQTVIQPNGEETVTEIEHRPTLDQMRDLIGGGYVELVRVLWEDKPTQMFVDEEGLIKALPYNARATEIYMNATRQGQSGMPPDSPAQPIAGIAVLYDKDVWE